jgi:hypothetical protein
LRGREAEGEAVGHLAELAIQVLDDFLIALLFGFAVVPVFLRDEEKSVVGGADEAEEAESGDCGGVLDAGHLGKNPFDLARGLIGALNRSRVRELQMEEHVASSGRKLVGSFALKNQAPAPKAIKSTNVTALLRSNAPDHSIALSAASLGERPSSM